MTVSKVTVVGMGALGILYGNFISRALGKDNLIVLADENRIARYRTSRVTANGVPCAFTYRTPEEYEGKAELLLFAVKATALKDAVETARPVIGPDTVIVSLLNGISSEETIKAELHGTGHVLYCVAQGMDALRSGTDLRYSKMGTLCLGLPAGQEADRPALADVESLFDRIALPYSHDDEIERRLWCKWMLNVGVNQVVMVHEGTFATVQKPGPEREEMIAAMREVIALARASGICLTEKDLAFYVGLIDSLMPDGMPSMRQDGLARRRSEVELFSGTVLRKAKALGLAVPVNTRLYEKVRQIEAQY